MPWIAQPIYRLSEVPFCLNKSYSFGYLFAYSLYNRWVLHSDCDRLAEVIQEVKQCLWNLTLRRVRAISGIKSIIYPSCVFVALAIQHTIIMRRCHLSPAWLYHIYPSNITLPWFL